MPNSKASAARSWLFVPGDSIRKLEKALATSADILIIDLEDSVAAQNKPTARVGVAEALRTHAACRERLWVRINSLLGADALLDLVSVMPARPGGLILPKSQGRSDLERLDHYLAVLELQAGAPPGDTEVMAICTETAQALFATGSYVGAPRLAALTWGAEDLAADIGAITNRQADGSYAQEYGLARSLCLFGAAAAGVPAIETIHPDFRDEARLSDIAGAARRAGFSGMMAIHPSQVETINNAFTPEPDEVRNAREIVALFAANPALGKVGHQGEMYDLPHLRRAQAVLAQTGEA